MSWRSDRQNANRSRNGPSGRDDNEAVARAITAWISESMSRSAESGSEERTRPIRASSTYHGPTVGEKRYSRGGARPSRAPDAEGRVIFGTILPSGRGHYIKRRLGRIGVRCRSRVDRVNLPRRRLISEAFPEIRRRRVGLDGHLARGTDHASARSTTIGASPSRPSTRTPVGVMRTEARVGRRGRWGRHG